MSTEPSFMKFVLCLITLLLGFSCSKNQVNRQHIERVALQGIWWSPEMFQIAAFQITDSTIYYPDHFKEYKYDLNDDSLLIYQDEGYILKSVILKVTTDTLVLLTHGIEHIYTKSETPVP